MVPPKHPKLIIFSRKTHGCWVPPFLETPYSTFGVIFGWQIQKGCSQVAEADEKFPIKKCHLESSDPASKDHASLCVHIYIYIFMMWYWNSVSDRDFFWLDDFRGNLHGDAESLEIFHVSNIPNKSPRWDSQWFHWPSRATSCLWLDGDNRWILHRQSSLFGIWIWFLFKLSNSSFQCYVYIYIHTILFSLWRFLLLSSKGFHMFSDVFFRAQPWS